MPNLRAIAIHNKVLQGLGEITVGRYGELLIAQLRSGAVVNCIGYDVEASHDVRIEVKSRVLGTDGKIPRVTLGPTNIKEATHVAALRFTPEYKLHSAKLLAIEHVKPLYEAKKQKKGQAHILFADFFGHSKAECLLEQLRSIMSAHGLEP